jgi:hypothetical protein
MPVEPAANHNRHPARVRVEAVPISLPLNFRHQSRFPSIRLSAIRASALISGFTFT